MQRRGSKYFSAAPALSTIWWGQLVEIQLYQNMVMLHKKIKGKKPATWSQIFCLHTPTPLILWMGSVGQNTPFQSIFMLHIKLRRITNAGTWSQIFWRIKNEATWFQIFCPQTPPPTLWMRSAYQNSTFSEHGKIANILPGDPYPKDGVNMSKFVFSEHVHVKLNGNTKCSNMVANILPANPFP